MTPVVTNIRRHNGVAGQFSYSVTVQYPGGWTGTHTDQPAHELVTEEIEWGNPQRHRVLKRSGRYYAVETIETGEVWGLVALTSRNEGMVYTKLVDESMGPNERSAPASILDLLSEPAPNEWAEEWRKNCRDNLERRAAQPKLKTGDVVKFAKPIRFADGTDRDTFTFVKQFTFQSNWGRVRLPKNWKQRYDWKVVT